MDPPPIQYVKTNDGFSIAYTDVGHGSPFVFMPLRRNHVEHAWEDSDSRDWLQGLAGRFRLIHYDSRGQGLSTRNLPENFSARDYEHDLEAVVDHLKLDRFALMGQVIFGHVAIRYAVRHPGRLRALVLGPVRPTLSSLRFLEIAKQNWDLLLFQLVGGAALPPDQRRAATDRLEQTTNQRDFIVSTAAFLGSSVESDLPRLSVPTLVLHPRDFPVFGQEESVQVASSIAGARMVLLDGATYLGDAAQGLRAIDEFLGALPAPQPSPAPSDGPEDNLSERELEVLRLLAQGKSNPEIAQELFITRNTVQNHVSSILIKTNLQNRAQAAVYARDHGIV